MELESRCRREVLELHRFFEAWYEGSLAATEKAFGRFEAVLAPSFQIITPDGRVHARGEILEIVRRGHGRGGRGIEIRNHRHRFTLGGGAVVVYEECQRRPAPASAPSGTAPQVRLSTAVFEQCDRCPNGLRWLHVHETERPRPGSPSPSPGHA